MAKIEVKCPKCGKIEVIKYGKSPEGKQRYKCKNTNCKCTTFLLEYSYNGSQPNIESAIMHIPHLENTSTAEIEHYHRQK